jgi:hypothetical protein
MPTYAVLQDYVRTFFYYSFALLQHICYNQKLDWTVQLWAVLKLYIFVYIQYQAITIT